MQARKQIETTLTDALRQANIPHRFWPIVKEDCQRIDQTAYDALASAVPKITTNKRRGIGILLIGPASSGKTSLMCHVLKVVTVNGWQVQYTTLVDIAEAYFNKGFRQLLDSRTDMIGIDWVDVCEDGSVNRGHTLALGYFLRACRDSGVPVLMASRCSSVSELVNTFGPDVAQYANRALVVTCQGSPMQDEETMRSL